MEVSILIVNYNTKDLILKCLRSIYDKTSGVEYEVIIVDNASSDDSVKTIRAEFPQIVMIENHENIGFGRANNLAYKYSTGDYIFLLNPDTVLINNATEILWEFLKNHSDIAIVGGQLLENDGLTTTHSYSTIFPSILMELDILMRGFITRQIERNNHNTLVKDGFIPVAFITGADMMLRRSDIELYGFFNPSFFLYFEETELSYRYKCRGKVSAFFPKAKIIHLAGSSFSTAKARSKFFIEGRKNYYDITHSFLYRKLANFIWNITFITVVIRNSFIASKRKEWMQRFRILINKLISNS